MISLLLSNHKKMFLENVITDVLASYPDINPEKIVFVVPNQRAILFLKKYFAQHIGRTCLSPEFVSMGQFVENITGYKTMPTMALLFELYDTYVKHCPSEPDDFETFVGWGQIILQDFNEIDQYLIDKKNIFPYIKAIKEVEHWSLSDELTPMQQKHLEFWNTLGVYYDAFCEKLSQKKQGYRGLLYRKATEVLTSYIEKSAQKLHIFAGFNALTQSEENIIQSILLSIPSQIYWDIDKSFINDEYHHAGMFIRHYTKHWKYYNNREPKWFSSDFSKPKQIRITGVPKSINQAHYTATCLHQITDKEWDRTAIVLADENLLLPVIQSVDSQSIPINITMGYPLKQTPISDLFYAFFKLYSNTSWYYKDVENILTHPNIQGLFSDNYVQGTISKMRKENWVYISKNQLLEFAQSKDIEVLDILFIPEKNISADVLIKKSFELIFLLKKVFQQNENPLLAEYLYRFYQLFNQLQELQNRFSFIQTSKTLLHLYNDLLTKQTLDFQGEPLQGLQIMGMLESQNLDFDNIIIVSVNEGILPAGKSANSFIPFDVKNNLGLPTYKQRDAIFTYHFYRLLQRAKNIHLIYNTETEALKGSEKSRFILQLTTLQNPDFDIIENVLAPQVTTLEEKVISVRKNEAILEKLRHIASNKGFSPSSLSTYVRNPIDFYKQSILQVYEERDVEEIIEARTFGDIVHAVLEELYTPYIQKTIIPENIQHMQLLVSESIERHFEKIYRRNAYNTGKNLLIFNVVQEYIYRFLAMEQELTKYTDVQLLALEEKFKVQVRLKGFDFAITLNGTIDRIERRNGKLYIVDYKTGKVENSHVTLAENHWDLLLSDFKYSKVFQLLMYAYIVRKSGLYADDEIFVGNYSFKNLKEGFMGFKQKGDKYPTAVNTTILEDFEQILEELLLEIFNERIPFEQKEV